MPSVTAWNPVTFRIEAIRALMAQGYDWSAIGRALLADAVVGVILLAGTLRAFHRLAD